MSDEMESDDDRRRRLTRERVRRHRRRLRYNRGVVLVEYTESMIEALVAAGMLLDSEAVDPDAISRAIGGFFPVAMVWKRQL